MIAVYPGDIIPERWAKSSRNAERHQIGLAGDIIPDSRATSPGISNIEDSDEVARAFRVDVARAFRVDVARDYEMMSPGITR